MSIGINIWDDYYDDGYVPEGENQSTYAYVEAKLSDEDCKNLLESFKLKLESLSSLDKEIKLTLNYYDSAEKYPNLVGTEHAWCLYKRWQLEFSHLTHELREQVVEDLKTWNFKYQGQDVEVYSES